MKKSSCHHSAWLRYPGSSVFCGSGCRYGKEHSPSTGFQAQGRSAEEHSQGSAASGHASLPAPPNLFGDWRAHIPSEAHLCSGQLSLSPSALRPLKPLSPPQGPGSSASTREPSRCGLSTARTPRREEEEETELGCFRLKTTARTTRVPESARPAKNSCSNFTFSGVRKGLPTPGISCEHCSCQALHPGINPGKGQWTRCNT